MLRVLENALAKAAAKCLKADEENRQSSTMASIVDAGKAMNLAPSF